MPAIRSGNRSVRCPKRSSANCGPPPTRSFGSRSLRNRSIMTSPFQLIGSVFADRYEIREEVGRGGAAVVYRARDIKHDRDVAVKLLHSELTQSMSAERFAREIEIASK